MWRHEAPHVLAALLRRSPDVGACEDAVQEALLAASIQWPRDGVPRDRRAWLVRVAHRRLVDAYRSADADAARVVRLARETRLDEAAEPSAEDVDRAAGQDDVLQMLFLCARPDLGEAARVCLTLRAVAGLSTRQIASLLLTPEATVAQRISRAKVTLGRSGPRLAPPSSEDAPARLHAVRQVLHLVFTAGHTTTSGPELVDVGLAEEAIWLAEQLRHAVPDDPETAGLLALMLLTHARARARTDADGELVPLASQDRRLWDRELIERGTALVEAALPRGPVGAYQLQAAIAAVHASATTAAETDWLQVVMLYRMLDRVAPSETVTIGLAGAIGMAHGAEAGLRALAPLLGTPAERHNHRLHATRAHLLEMAGDAEAAGEAYALAARLTQSVPEQRYLNAKVAALTPG